MTKLLTLGNLFSTAVRAAVVAKLITLGIFFLIPLIVALRTVAVVLVVVVVVVVVGVVVVVVVVVVVANLAVIGIFRFPPHLF